MRLLNQEEAFSLLEQIEPTPSVQSLSRIRTDRYKLSKSNPKLKPEIYLISIFQKNITQFTNTEIDSSLQIRLVPVQSLKEIILSIDTAYLFIHLFSQNKITDWYIQVSNYGNSNLEDVRVGYRIDQQNFLPLRYKSAQVKTKLIPLILL